MSQISFRDIEQLSAYLDDGLSSAERARLAARLKADPQLTAALQALSESRAALRQLPQRRVPRNFTLTPKMAGVKPPLPRSYPVFRFASALAALLFFFASALNFVAPRVSMLAASAPMAYGRGGGGGDGNADAALEQSALPTEAAAEKTAPIAPAPEGTATPEPTLMAFTAPPTATPETLATEFPTLEPVPAEGERNIGGGADPALEAQMAAAAVPPIPSAAVWSFVGVAIIAGAIAYFIRWRTDKQFDQTRRK
jgi:hypothetical protein